MLAPKKPTPAPEPETLDVTTSTDDKIVLLLDKLIREQRNTVDELSRVNARLMFFIIAIILGAIYRFVSHGPLFIAGS